jgi:hypothetical protein
MAYETLRHRTKKDTIDTRAAVAADHDEVRAQIAGQLRDLDLWLPNPNVANDAPVGRRGLGCERFELFLRLFELARVLGSTDRPDVHQALACR